MTIRRISDRCRFHPPLLYVRGTLHANDRYGIAIVGSRQATQYGKAVAQQFSGRLAACGLTVVSGFARGVDSSAHQAALQAGGRTIGVLGSGLAVCYPAENGKLGNAIVERGALITEYPMEGAPDRFNFPERNHIIAALSLGTIVVEAAEKSGALITANRALDENRFVFAVSGDITRLNSRGSNALVQSGARLVQRPEDVLAEMRAQLKGYLREDALATAETAVGAPATAGAEGGTSGNSSEGAPGQLKPEEAMVLALIRQEPLYFDAIAARLDPAVVSVARLSAILLALELKRLIKQMPGKLYMVLG